MPVFRMPVFRIFRMPVFRMPVFFRIPGSVEELPMSRVNFLRGFFW